MTTKPKASTLPLYKYIFPSEVANKGIGVTSAGSTAAKDTWSLVPGGIAPWNLAPVTATLPQACTIKGQNGTASYAAAGGSIILSPGVGSVFSASGNVEIRDTSGNAGWDKTHIVLGIYHLWVDATGKLRIKNSVPLSDTDGTVVGTQT
jgi:hypothetical protein